MDRSSYVPIWRLFRTCWPLSIAVSADTLAAAIPRYSLGALSNPHELSLYTAAAFVFVGQGVLLGAIADAGRPRLARARRTSRRLFIKAIAGLCAPALASSLAGVIGALLLGGQGLSLLYGSRYSDGADSLRWLMLATIPWNIAGIFGTALTAAGRFGLHTFATCAQLPATLITAFVLVPNHGAVGAAWALAIGLIVRMSVSAFSLVETLRTRRSLL